MTSAGYRHVKIECTRGVLAKDSTATERLRQTKHPLTIWEICPFKMKVYYSAEHKRWFLLQQGHGCMKHVYHPPQEPDFIQVTTNCLSEKEKAQFFNLLQVTAFQWEVEGTVVQSATGECGYQFSRLHMSIINKWGIYGANYNPQAKLASQQPGNL